MDAAPMIEPAAPHTPRGIALHPIRPIMPRGHKTLNLATNPTPCIDVPSLMLYRCASHLSQHIAKKLAASIETLGRLLALAPDASAQRVQSCRALESTAMPVSRSCRRHQPSWAYPRHPAQRRPPPWRLQSGSRWDAAATDSDKYSPLGPRARLEHVPPFAQQRT
jgi:hypothetical protein